MNQTQMTQEMKECLANCLECHRICTETVTHVLHGGHVHSEAKHLVALLDCAQICNACAALCEEHPDPDGEMKLCARICRTCAESCSRMKAS
jgi:hypothetical protein